jgi:hypothetical protein
VTVQMCPLSCPLITARRRPRPNPGTIIIRVSVFCFVKPKSTILSRGQQRARVPAKPLQASHPFKRCRRQRHPAGEAATPVGSAGASEPFALDRERIDRGRIAPFSGLQRRAGEPVPGSRH